MRIRYEKTVVTARFSWLPLLAMLIIGYVLFQHRKGIETGLTDLLIFGSIALGLSIALGVGMGLWFRARRHRYPRSVQRPLNTTQDIPIIDYRLNPPEIEPVTRPETILNGESIRAPKTTINQRYGKR